MSERTRKNTKSNTRDVNAAQRARLAVQLRAQKLTYDEIAARCGYANRGACHNAIQRELSRVVVEDVTELRKEEADSLDRLEAECWKRLYDKSHEKAMLFAVDRIVQIKDRRARLLGLDTAKDSTIAAAQIIVQEVPAGYLGEKTS